MSINNKLTFIGGDDRSFYMVELLHEQSYQIMVYGLKMIRQIEGVSIASSLKEALSFCDTIVCPVPFSRDKINILSSCSGEDMNIENFISYLGKGYRVFGGDINSQVRESLNYKNIPFYDFMETEAVSIKNAVATAEGAIAEAIKSSPINLHKSACLVLGFGRCAKILAYKLSGLDVDVMVGARNIDQLATADSYGYDTIHLSQFSEIIPKCDFIFNTIPAMVLEEPVLSMMKKNAVIIDIATYPGGTDFEKCRELGINAYLCLGLPGKYAPLTSAEILNSVLLQQL